MLWDFAEVVCGCLEMDVHSEYTGPFARAVFSWMAPLGSSMFLISQNNPFAMAPRASERSPPTRTPEIERLHPKAENESRCVQKQSQ